MQHDYSCRVQDQTSYREQVYVHIDYKPIIFSSKLIWIDWSAPKIGHDFRMDGYGNYCSSHYNERGPPSKQFMKSSANVRFFNSDQKGGNYWGWSSLQIYFFKKQNAATFIFKSTVTCSAQNKLRMYRLDGQVCLEVVDPLFINFGAVNFLLIHKMVDNTRFKTNLTVQAVCS